jgi:hypothetical protein
MFQSFINASSGRFGTRLKAKYPVAGGRVQSCFPGGFQVVVMAMKPTSFPLASRLMSRSSGRP